MQDLGDGRKGDRRLVTDRCAPEWGTPTATAVDFIEKVDLLSSWTSGACGRKFEECRGSLVTGERQG